MMQIDRRWLIAGAVAVVIGVAAITAGLVRAQTVGPYALFRTQTGAEVKLNLEIADTPERQSRGLMGRETLADDAGMIFVFPQMGRIGFWMKDTLLPLSIAFIDDTGVVVDILDMEPQTTDVHAPRADYRYAIEVNQGYFRRNGIAPGDPVQLMIGPS